MPQRYSVDGFLLDDDDREWGYCNACGEEAESSLDCCPDGEVVPYDQPSEPESTDA